MTLSFQRASELVQQTGGDMTQEQMDEFEFLTGGFKKCNFLGAIFSNCKNK